MKNLRQFESFDWNAFAKGKEFLVTGSSEYINFESKEHIGKKVDVVISRDDTEYQQTQGEQRNNRFEKLTFKVQKDVEVPIDAIVVPKGVVATIYGDYRNQLSVKCDDLEIVKTPNVKERTNV